MAALAGKIDSSLRVTHCENSESVCLEQSGNLVSPSPPQSSSSSATFESQKQHTDVNESTAENSVVVVIESDDNNNNQADDKESEAAKEPSLTSPSTASEECVTDGLRSSCRFDSNCVGPVKNPADSSSCCNQQPQVTLIEQIPGSSPGGQIGSLLPPLLLAQQQQQQQQYPFYANVACWYQLNRFQQPEPATSAQAHYLRPTPTYYAPANHPLAFGQSHPATDFGAPICVGLDQAGAPISIASHQVPYDSAWHLYQCTGGLGASQVHAMPLSSLQQHQNDFAGAAAYTGPWLQQAQPYQAQLGPGPIVAAGQSPLIFGPSPKVQLRQQPKQTQHSRAQQCSLAKEKIVSDAEVSRGANETCEDDMQPRQSDASDEDNCAKLHKDPATAPLDSESVNKPAASCPNLSALDPTDCVVVFDDDADKDQSQDDMHQQQQQQQQQQQTTTKTTTTTPATSASGYARVCESLAECNDRDEMIDGCVSEEEDDEDEEREEEGEEEEEEGEEESDEDINEEQSSVSVDCCCETAEETANHEELRHSPPALTFSSTTAPTNSVPQPQSSALIGTLPTSSASNGRHKSSMTTKANSPTTKNCSLTNNLNAKQQHGSGSSQKPITVDTSQKICSNRVSNHTYTTQTTNSSQPTAHASICQTHVITQPNCYVNNLDFHKSHSDLRPIATCQYAPQPLSDLQGFRSHPVYYNHFSHQYNQQVIHPQFVWQASNASTYYGPLLPNVNSGIKQQQQQPYLYYGYSYPCYTSVQSFRQANLLQQALYQPASPVTHMPRSQIYNPNPHQPMSMHLEPLLIPQLSAQSLVWQSPNSMLTSASQFDYLNRFQHQSQASHPSNVRLDPGLRNLLPVDVEPAKVRQAYGMDKVWLDEFEALFSQFMSSNMLWALVEVESNPSIRCDADIVGYKGRYIVRISDENRNYITVNRDSGDFVTDPILVKQTLCDEVSDIGNGDENRADSHSPVSGDVSEDGDNSCSGVDRIDRADLRENDDHHEGEDATGQNFDAERADGQTDIGCDKVEPRNTDTYDTCSGQSDSDCDSGAVIPKSTSTTSAGEESMSDESQRKSDNEDDQTNESDAKSIQLPVAKPDKKHLRRFRMFIDSAKVRFCCDICGHGWTSMKGRVVFWYELFELVESDKSSGNLLGYCAYKLFGQQCDVCQVEGRFERPMWYPEEVTKALNNLYNKIGQVYFGFKMPAIDKQRRAGKPKTSHNSTLCQACHDGVCTDRK